VYSKREEGKSANWSLACCARAVGHYGRSVEWFRKTVSLAPHHAGATEASVVAALAGGGGGGGGGGNGGGGSGGCGGGGAANESGVGAMEIWRTADDGTGSGGGASMAGGGGGGGGGDDDGDDDGGGVYGGDGGGGLGRQWGSALAHARCTYRPSEAGGETRHLSALERERLAGLGAALVGRSDQVPDRRWLWPPLRRLGGASADVLGPSAAARVLVCGVSDGRD
jgi:hypothetical protein